MIINRTCDEVCNYGINFTFTERLYFHFYTFDWLRSFNIK